MIPVSRCLPITLFKHNLLLINICNYGYGYAHLEQSTILLSREYVAMYAVCLPENLERFMYRSPVSAGIEDVQAGWENP